MITDKTTRNDLNLFSQDGKASLFSVLDLTTTSQGSHALFDFFQKPFSQQKDIINMQQTISSLIDGMDKWPEKISNGTIMVVEKFLETPFAEIPEKISVLEAFFYRIFNPSDYSLLSYSVIHCTDLIVGMDEVMNLMEGLNSTSLLDEKRKEIEKNLPLSILDEIKKNPNPKEWSFQKTLRICKWMRFTHRRQIRELVRIHSQLDAWLSMAKSVRKYELTFPEWHSTDEPMIHVRGMRHLLLENPVEYDLKLDQKNNFLFLTGANMAGKSTFIKSLGVSVYLAHLGMGVPCSEMRLSIFDGILTNINIQDDITKGESYFYREVKRIKATAETVNDGKRWLILIDELFKGTNITDAMNCSIRIIQGLLRRKNALYVLSTHLYEISESLKNESGILFRYFETEIQNGEYTFSYRLCEGVSQDKLGMLILKKEGVLDLLQNK